MRWVERLLGAAAGALVVGLVLAMVDVGPTSVAVGLAAVAAAALGGSLLDELVGPPVAGTTAGRAMQARPAPGTRHDTTTPARQPPAWTSGPLPVAPPVVADPPTTPPPRRPIPRDLTTEPDPVPDAQWVGAEAPELDRPSDRWRADGERDLLAEYRAAPAGADLGCADCGRTVPAPASGRPAGCPVADRADPCPLHDGPVELVTELRSLRDVSRG